MIADIAEECERLELAQLAVYQAYHEIWTGSSKENPFMPVSGEILNRIKFHHGEVMKFKKYLETPEPAPQIEKKIKQGWPDFTDEQKIDCLLAAKEFTKVIARIYLKGIGAPQNLIDCYYKS